MGRYHEFLNFDIMVVSLDGSSKDQSVQAHTLHSEIHSSFRGPDIWRPSLEIGFEIFGQVGGPTYQCQRFVWYCNLILHVLNPRVECSLLHL